MHEDAEFLPDTAFRNFTRSPLTRLLRVDDYVEWTVREGRGLGAYEETRRRGTITAIRRIEDDAELDEMSSWLLHEFVFTIRDGDLRGVSKLRTTYGGIRLAPRPEKMA